MKPDRITAALLLAAFVLAPGICHAQQESKPTIRHHLVEEPAEDPSSPEVAHAEEAMQHKDFAAANLYCKKPSPPSLTTIAPGSTWEMCTTQPATAPMPSMLIANQLR